jgi:crossover junction endodeoxyribonuclease RusA
MSQTNDVHSSQYQTNAVFFSSSLPLPPSVNHAYQIVRSRRGAMRMVATSTLRRFKWEALAWLVRASICNEDVMRALYERRGKSPLGVELRLYLPYLWRQDLDDPVRAALDAAFDYLGLSDNQVVDLHVQKFLDASNPRAEIEIYCRPDALSLSKPEE